MYRASHADVVGGAVGLAAGVKGSRAAGTVVEIPDEFIMRTLPDVIIVMMLLSVNLTVIDVSGRSSTLPLDPKLIVALEFGAVVIVLPDVIVEFEAAG